MATYYNQIPANFVGGDTAQFTAGTHRVTLSPGKYQIVAVGSGGGGLYGNDKGTYISYGGGGGGTNSTTVELKAATSVNVSVGSPGNNGYYNVTAGIGINKWVDYVTAWYDSNSGRYYVPVSGPDVVESSPATGGGGSSVSGSGISVSAGGGGAASKSGNGYSYGSNYSSGYVTIRAFNAPPSTPGEPTFDTPLAGRSLNIQCTPSTDPDGDAVQYIFEGRVDQNAFATIGTVDKPNTVYSVPTNGEKLQIRVKAVDNKGAESAYATVNPKTIIYNFPPTISDSDRFLGNFEAPVKIGFSADDPDIQDTINVKIMLDGTEIMSIQNAVRKKEYQIDLTQRWITLPNGDHTIEILASDNAGGSAKRIFRFQRVTNGLHLMLAEPITPRGGGIVRSLQALFFYDAPSDAAVQILVCNNARATTPTWQDFTPYHKKGIFTFEDVPNDAEAGFSVQIEITKSTLNKQNIYFTGATLMLNANGNESDKWADNIMFTQAFTGSLLGIVNLGQMAKKIDENTLGGGGSGGASGTFSTNALQGYYRSPEGFQVSWQYVDIACESALETRSIAFPMAFSDTPAVFVSCENYRNLEEIGLSGAITTLTQTIGKATCSIQLAGGVSYVVEEQDFRVRVLAFGRWK